MYKLTCTLIALCACVNFAFCQADTSITKTNDPKLKALLALPVTEKAYLHFDKPYYAVGDTIYFKAYVAMGELHKPSQISGVLHVELIDPANKLYRSIKLQLLNGVAWGDFTLADSLKNGSYRIRAYTQWMRNEANPAFFEKTIPVGNQNNQPAGSLTADKTDINFFPEGGSLVAGISSNIAFKAIGSNGLGVPVKGTIIDNDNKQITSFSATHLGMGSFYLTPQAGKSYKAMLTYADGGTNSVDLPVAIPKGIVLSVNNDSIAKATVSIEANKAYYDENHDKAYSVVINAGGKATLLNYKLDNPVISFDILKRRLGTGVVTITLFTSENEPLCERLLFAQNYDKLNITLNTDKAAYLPKEKVNINLKALTRTGEAASGSFSVSVVDESKVIVNESSERTILTDLLLTSDLKGYIEQPNYYFTKVSDKVNQDLDLVMLTHGYRKFQWKTVLANPIPVIKFQPEKGIDISGIASDLNSVPLNKGQVTLISPPDQVLSERTNDQGVFRFSNLVFTDSAKFILQATTNKGKKYTKLTYNGNYNQPYIVAKTNSGDTTTSNLMGRYLQNSDKQNQYLQQTGKLKGRMLQEVVIKSKTIYTPKMTSRYGMADQVIAAEQIGNSGMLAYKLMPLLRGMTLSPTAEINFYKPQVPNQFPGVQVKVVVNDVEMTPSFNINDIDPGQVERVEIIRNPAAPAIIFTVQYGINPRYITSTGILPIKVSGFYKARDFYSPKYDHADDGKDLPDYRSTIYWKPNLSTDKNGMASFDFYNSVSAGTYRVVVEGIDDKGNIGRQVYWYKVQ